MIDYQAMSPKGLRELKASIVLIDRRAAEIRASIQRVDRLKDDAADLHSRMTAPIQSGLKEIEQLEITAIVGRDQIDPAIEQRRKNLLAQLESENANLERAVQDADARLKPLRAELDALMQDYPNVNVIDGALLRSAPIEQQQLHEGLGLAGDGLGQIISAYSKRAGEVDYYVKQARDERNPGQEQLLLARKAKWEFAISALGTASTEIKTQRDTLRQSIING